VLITAFTLYVVKELCCCVAGFLCIQTFIVYTIPYGSCHCIMWSGLRVKDVKGCYPLHGALTIMISIFCGRTFRSLVEVHERFGGIFLYVEGKQRPWRWRQWFFFFWIPE